VSGAQSVPLRARGFVGAAIERLEDFLLESAEADGNGAQPAGGTGAEPAPPASRDPRPVIAVIGLARRCGATVVARALAAELAARDPAGVGAVASGASAASIPLATTAARQLAEVLANVPGATTSAVGRLCLVEGADHVALADSSRHLAPLVLDPGSAELESSGASVADTVVLVATPRVERALVAAAASCLRRMGTEPLAALNISRRRVEAGAERGIDLPHTDATIELPHSRAGAQLAMGGRQPRGEFGRAVAALADLCEGPG
jgi:hypothetical protein